MARRKRILWILFALYCAAMGYLLFGREEAPPGLPYAEQMRLRLNLTPLHTIRRQLHLLSDLERPWLIRHSAINLLGNVILFIPLGIFLPMLAEKLRKFRKTLLCAAGLITAVELAQVLTLLGRCDIDDLILNLLGAAVGYGLYKWIFKASLPD